MFASLLHLSHPHLVSLQLNYELLISIRYLASTVSKRSPGTFGGTIRPPVNSSASGSVSTPSDKDWIVGGVVVLDSAATGSGSILEPTQYQPDHRK